MYVITSDVLYQRAQDILDVFPKSEIEAWVKHDITKAVLLLLAGDLQNLKEQWAAGTYATPSESETIMLNARALGELQATESIEQMVRELPSRVEDEEDDNEEGDEE